MKKMVVYGTDKWAKELLTLSRYEKIAYFVCDTNESESFDFKNDKKVYDSKVLLEENKDDIVIIVSNSKKYETVAKKLKEYGFEENIHFFNGWKLDGNFYEVIGANQDWKLDESINADIFENAAWEKRAELMSSMIPADVRSVMDLGCGDCKLKKYLSEDIKYIGLDYCWRNEDTLICDLNKESLPSIYVDMYYLAGILPYINDKTRLFHEMKNAKYILLSAYPMEQFLRLDGHAFELPSFYFQNYSNDDMINELYGGGYALIKCKYDYKVMNAHFFLFQNIKTLGEK